MKVKLNVAAVSTALVALAFTGGSAFAQKKYDTGASDTEIKIGNIMPYSGPASAYGVIGKMEEAYFKMINDQGGINGRKIKFITYDDGYSPPKASVLYSATLMPMAEAAISLSRIAIMARPEREFSRLTDPI
jgi:branched-chain amino acid transport system substrate-binding protein